MKLILLYDPAFRNSKHGYDQWKWYFPLESPFTCKNGFSCRLTTDHDKLTEVRIVLVWLPNRLISAGLEPVLSHTEKSMYRIVQFSMNIKMYNHNIKNNVIIVHFCIRGKLFTIWLTILHLWLAGTLIMEKHKKYAKIFYN